MRKSELEQPEIVVLVGIPGSGKSTWVRQQMARYPEKNYVVISLDDIIEELGAAAGIQNYGIAFYKFIGQATSMMKAKAQQAFADRRNIIWDQTSLTEKKRRSILNQARGYRAEAVVWSLTDEEWKRRFNKRKAEVGKDIPQNILDNMAKSFTMPNKTEGFEKVTVIRN